MPQISQVSACVYPGTPFWRAGLISGRVNSRLHVRRSDFEVLACCVPPSVPALRRAGLALRGELSVQPLKHGVGTVIGTQPQNPAPGVFDHAPGLEHPSSTPNPVFPNFCPLDPNKIKQLAL